jgi:hypothetical protein
MEPLNIDPMYMRGRIAGLNNLREQYMRQLPGANPIQRPILERDIAALRNGVYPDDVDPDEIEIMVMKDKQFSNEPLTTTELMTYNTYFELYPWKIAGQQIVTSSRDFPVTVVGMREDVEAAIDKTIGNKQRLDLEALALELELKLFDL